MLQDEQLTAILMDHGQAYQATNYINPLPRPPKETGELEAPTPLLSPSPLLPTQVEDAPKAPPAHKPPAKRSTKDTMASSCTAANSHARVRLAKPLRVRRSSSTAPNCKLPRLAQPTVPLALPRISFDLPLPVTTPSKVRSGQLSATFSI